MKKTFYTFVLFSLFYKSMACESLDQDRIAPDPIDRAFRNDDDIYRTMSFAIESSTFYACPFDLNPYKGKHLNLLSHVSLGNYQEEENLSDQTCQQYISSYNIMCSPETPPEQARKIREREKQVSIYRNTQMMEEEIKGWIQWFTEKKEWGVIVDEKSRKRAVDFVKQISEQCKRNFILRHSLSVGDTGLSGTVALYPGHNPKIIEDLQESCVITAPRWAIGSVDYEINFSKEILHVKLISVESYWRSRRHGYALVRYLADFSKEHFVHIVRHMTVDCRNAYSRRIFEKVGFVINTLAEKELLYAATHFRGIYHIEWQRQQAVMEAWCKSPAQRYRDWLTEAYPEIFPDQYHKVGYHY